MQILLTRVSIRSSISQFWWSIYWDLFWVQFGCVCSTDQNEMFFPPVLCQFKWFWMQKCHKECPNPHTTFADEDVQSFHFDLWEAWFQTMLCGTSMTNIEPREPITITCKYDWLLIFSSSHSPPIFTHIACNLVSFIDIGQVIRSAC